jgi:hypothetical protein
MTSIEWLIDSLENPKLKWDDIKEQAKEMHKQEIIEAWEMGRFNIDEVGLGEEYYQEIFVSKGNDEQHILNEAYHRYTIEDEIEAFIQGAEWMQEQLKIK